MPGSYGSSEVGGSSTSSSPGLLLNLRNYRLETNSKTFPKSATSSAEGTTATSQSATSSVTEFSPESCGIEEVPETPEFRRHQSSPAVKGAPDSTTSPSKEAGNSLSRKLLDYRHTSALGSNDSTPELSLKESREQAMDEYDAFIEKEHCLREFLKLYPSADIMEAQDILVSTKWNLKEAIERAKNMPVKGRGRKPAGNVAASQRGVVYSDCEQSNDCINTSAQSASEKFPEEIVLDSDDDDMSSVNRGRHSNGVNSTSHNSLNNSSEVVITRKRKKAQLIISDSEEENDGVAPLQSYVKDSEQEAIVSDGSHHPDSTFSVLDYQPKSTAPLGPYRFQASTSSLSHNSEVSTYNKTKPKQQIQPSANSDNSTNYSGKVKKAPGRKPARIKNYHKKRRREHVELDDDDEEEYGNNDVYDSEDSDCEMTPNPARTAVLNFLQEAVMEELVTIPGCSKKKAEAIINYRPFGSWADLVQKFSFDKSLSTDLLNGAKKVLDMRTAVNRLMNKCQRIALEMEDLVEALKENKEHGTDYVSQQPDLLNPNMHLTGYQMLGLNWLLLMHNQEVNGILADEMGLGKTVQAIAFLAYLKQQNAPGPHLIVCPSSTLDNWQNEMKTWWPSASVLCYHGSQDNRRELRIKIIEGELDEFDVMVTTYNMVASSAEDRSFFKKLAFQYVVFDEAHMLKNMASQRYQHLMRVKAARRLLLTGTPLQNNLVELMSLLIFAVPHMFSGKTEQVKQMFSAVCKSDEGKSKFERERIEHAKRIMKPFVLRRLKSEVLKDLPHKNEEVKFCKMTSSQAERYKNLVTILSEEVRKNKEKEEMITSGAGMMMQLRKAANHPLLLRNQFTEDKLIKMSKLMLKEPTHVEANPDFIFEDMCVMSDFELHRLCKQYKSLKAFVLSEEVILDSGKFAVLDNLLPKMIDEGNRVLLFSQFTMVLDIVEEYMQIRKRKYLRLDGQIPVNERQQLIDEYNRNKDIPIFLLSTRAGGLGINLTAANVVLIHDIDFNPYNDKQAEDRCHRVGQVRDVTVIRMISEGTIEEGMLQRANDKLKLEKDITSSTDEEEKDSASVAKLLRDALGLSQSTRS